ncbi:LysM peptidoglycan-binding domain-containing protein [Paenibacillus koleovorans]|uniref:LysM peptidoglycan-binding domain-containing protein n=1 Tax=Paenibacillus koleovorans TaxID=121608 RepID=UPI000FDC5D2F|nr:LysM peptidoglycan-binding domain-containing protein [Paenibacillus koleovorans]
MSQQPGLRFDIYERILLPEDAESIRELDGMELIPQIEVDVNGDQAVVRGHLLLQGTYAGENGEAETRSAIELRHYIPVEITLPMNRVDRVERIAVEIDNFDVDLLSSRSLNVTGVLSLHGIELQSAAPNVWREEEEVLFVHQVEQPQAIEPFEAEQQQEQPSAYAQAPPSSPWFQQPASPYRQQGYGFPQQPYYPYAQAPVQAPSVPQPAAYPYYQQQVEEEVPGGREEQAEEQWAEQLAEQAEESQELAFVVQEEDVQEVYEDQREDEEFAAAPPPREEILVDTYEDMTLLDQFETEAEQAAENTSLVENSEMNNAVVETEEEERDTSMKIAFIKRAEESQTSDFKSYIHKNEAYRRAAENEREREAAQAADTRAGVEEQNPADVLEWKKLFLSEGEEQKFKKVRMVIVQKEETLETIARRYDKKPQELKLYNKLPEPEISAGQVLYIP